MKFFWKNRKWNPFMSQKFYGKWGNEFRFRFEENP